MSPEKEKTLYKLEASIKKKFVLRVLMFPFVHILPLVLVLLFLLLILARSVTTFL